MAKKESRRIIALRKKHYDRVSFVIPKGNRELIRIAGIIKNVPSSEIWRRALQKYVGLPSWISEDDADDLKDVETLEEAKYALLHLRRKYRDAMVQGKQVP